MIDKPVFANGIEENRERIFRRQTVGDLIDHVKNLGGYKIEIDIPSMMMTYWTGTPDGSPKAQHFKRMVSLLDLSRPLPQWCHATEQGE